MILYIIRAYTSALSSAFGNWNFWSVSPMIMGRRATTMMEPPMVISAKFGIELIIPIKAKPVH